MDGQLTFEDFKKEILDDYKICVLSRQLSLTGRKEVQAGYADFGIFGDGREVAQVALAKFFMKGDWRSGYYHDQTFMLAAGLLDPGQFFALLYGDTDLRNNPHNGGRSVNNIFSTPGNDGKGKWLNLTERKNCSAGITSAAGQMPCLSGIALASKLYRSNKNLDPDGLFSVIGNEVAFGSISVTGTSQGDFLESINAASVLQVPMVITVWDDAVISDTKRFKAGQCVPEGIIIYKVKGWDYPAMVKTFGEGVEKARKDHLPVLFYIEELTQPPGQYASGESFKSHEQFKREEENDGIKKFRGWIISKAIAVEDELKKIDDAAITCTRDAQKKAWDDYIIPIRRQRDDLIAVIDKRSCICRKEHIDKIGIITLELKKIPNPIRKDIFSAARKILRHMCIDCPERRRLQQDLHLWLESNYNDACSRYDSDIYSENERSALKVKEVKPVLSREIADGGELLRDNWDLLISKNPGIVILGEEVSKTFEVLKKKYGESRILDTGNCKNTIVGQGIGMALRGLRPVVDIPDSDDLLSVLRNMSDDLATRSYRTAGQQKVPVIISTRGHRLRGIMNSGSNISPVINSVRGIYVCVPRNMTQAAGFYNTLVESDDPALVIEPLNGSRIKENRPSNLSECLVPLGVPEIINEGSDVTLVTYSSCVRIAQEAIAQLKELNISVELIDVQTLLPFDINNVILQSVKKTNKIIFFDQDVPGGATAYMMQKVLEGQKAFKYLDYEPVTLCAKEHGPAYGTDGDYFSNPNAEDVFECIYGMMHAYNPAKYPEIY
jgi:2-oxoisovalerate dehydrogenase E1 component